MFWGPYWGPPILGNCHIFGSPMGGALCEVPYTTTIQGLQDHTLGDQLGPCIADSPMQVACLHAST